MNYYIGQALGLAATVCTIILPFFKKKWQILILNICVNLFVALNFVLIGQIGSAAFLCTVAIFQSIDSMVHDVKGTPISLVEKILFLCLYLGFGFFGMVTAPRLRSRHQHRQSAGADAHRRRADAHVLRLLQG